MNTEFITVMLNTSKETKRKSLLQGRAQGRLSGGGETLRMQDAQDLAPAERRGRRKCCLTEDTARGGPQATWQGHFQRTESGPGFGAEPSQEREAQYEFRGAPGWLSR